MAHAVQKQVNYEIMTTEQRISSNKTNSNDVGDDVGDDVRCAKAREGREHEEQHVVDIASLGV
jgi:cell division protein FtsL